MVTIYRIALRKEQLDAIPEAERNLLFALGHLANELNVLTKLFYWAAHNQREGDIFQHASNAQSMTIVRLLCGKMHEGWRLLQTSYYGTAISREYNPLYSEEEQQSFRELSRFFGGENVITKVRNNFAFHYSAAEIGRCYAESNRDDQLEMILSESNANTLYDYAEILVNQTLLEQLNPSDPSKAMEVLIADSTRLTGLFNRAIGACFGTAIRRHLGADLEQLGAEAIELEGLAHFEAIGIPYFVEVEKD